MTYRSETIDCEECGDTISADKTFIVEETDSVVCEECYKKLSKVESDRPATGRRKEIAHDVVREILENGLRNSTWRDNYSDAYNDLRKYQADLEGSVLKILERYDA